jgi:hypothetical protein
MPESEIVVNNQRKLFRYHIDRNIAQEASKKNFWYRTNRWRFNSLDKSTSIDMELVYASVQAGSANRTHPGYDWAVRSLRLHIRQIQGRCPSLIHYLTSREKLIKIKYPHLLIFFLLLDGLLCQ